jgi:fibronectin-binding autotransporter adhesin
LGLAKTGTGTLTLSGVNTYQGGTTVNGGTLAVLADNNLGNGLGSLAFGSGTLQFLSGFISNRAVTLNSGGGTFDTNGNGPLLTGSISRPGGLTKVGIGDLTLAGASTYSGPTNVLLGTLAAGATNVFSPASAFTVVSGGALNLNGFNQSIGSLAGDGLVGNAGPGPATLTTGGNNSSTTFSGVIFDAPGTMRLTKAGTGTMILSGDNSYTGGTTISAGTLQLGNGGANGSITGDVVDNGTFATNRSDTFAFGGVISGTGTFAQIGPGTTILTAANTYSGGTAINGGVLAVAADVNLGAASGGLVFGGGTLQFLSGFTTNRAVTLNAGGGSFDTNGNNAVLGGPISGAGGLTKIGSGTLTLSAASSYSGATAVNAGMLRAGAANAFASGSAFTVASGATLDLNSFNQTIGSLGGAGSVTLGAATLTTGSDNTSTTFSGTISGTGALIKLGSGVLTLSGANTYSGGITLAGGMLSLANNQALGSGALTTTGSVVDYANGVTIANAIVINSNSTQLQVTDRHGDAGRRDLRAQRPASAREDRRGCSHSRGREHLHRSDHGQRRHARGEWLDRKFGGDGERGRHSHRHRHGGWNDNHERRHLRARAGRHAGVDDGCRQLGVPVGGALSRAGHSVECLDRQRHRRCQPGGNRGGVVLIG